MGWTVPGFREVQNLGDGTFGRVVLAVHEESGEQFAIKYLNEWMYSDRSREAFRKEVAILREVRSRHVVRVFGLVDQGEAMAIIMEYLPGRSLKKLLAGTGVLSPVAACVVMKGSLLGLADAHRGGVVHQDYKPDNVLVDASGVSALIDFGVARRDGESTRWAGTPAYMAPELWGSTQASFAGDIYATTVVFFECLVGRRPFEASDFPELGRMHAEAERPLLSVPAHLRPLIKHGMARNPANRPPNAAVFVEWLDRVAGEAYGPNWEERGTVALGQMAAAAGAGYVLGALTGGSGMMTDPVAASGALPPTGSLLSGSVKSALAAVVAVGVVGAVAYPLLNEEDASTAKGHPSVTAGPPTSPGSADSPSPVVGPTITAEHRVREAARFVNTFPSGDKVATQVQVGVMKPMRDLPEFSAEFAASSGCDAHLIPAERAAAAPIALTVSLESSLDMKIVVGVRGVVPTYRSSGGLGCWTVLQGGGTFTLTRASPTAQITGWFVLYNVISPARPNGHLDKTHYLDVSITNLSGSEVASKRTGSGPKVCWGSRIRLTGNRCG